MEKETLIEDAEGICYIKHLSEGKFETFDYFHHIFS